MKLRRRFFAGVAASIAATSASAGLAVSAGAAATTAPSAVPAGAHAVASLIARARAATLSAHDVTIEMREVIASEPVSVEVSGSYPSYVRALVDVGAESEGLVVDGATVYFEASAGIWESAFKLSAPSATTLSGHWYSTNRNDALLGSLNGINPKALESSLFASLKKIASAPGVVVRERRVGSVPAYVIDDRYGEVYIASTGQPYLLRLTTKSGAAAGFAQFSGFDTPIHKVLPVASGVLDTAFHAAQSTHA